MAFDQGRALGVLKNGDLVVVVQGWTKGSGHTNTLRIIPVH